MGVCDGKIVLTVMGTFQPEEKPREMSSSPDSPSTLLKHSQSWGFTIMKPKGLSSVKRPQPTQPNQPPHQTDSPILINNESSCLRLPRHSLNLPSTILLIAPSRNQRESFLSFFFLFLLLHSLYTSYIVVKTCVKRCVILYVVFVLTISETPSKYW